MFIISILVVSIFFFFFKQKTAYEIGLGIPAEPLFRSNSAQNVYRYVEHDQKTGLTTFGQFHQRHRHILPAQRSSEVKSKPAVATTSSACFRLQAIRRAAIRIGAFSASCGGLPGARST